MGGLAHFLYRWLWLDAWVPLWPNLAASAVVYVAVALKLRAMRKLHEELRDLHVKHHAEHMTALAGVRPQEAPPWRRT